MSAASGQVIGSITKQFGAWLCHWADGDHEEFTAHSGHASCEKYLREVLPYRLQFRRTTPTQVLICVKGPK